MSTSPKITAARPLRPAIPGRAKLPLCPDCLSALGGSVAAALLGAACLTQSLVASGTNVAGPTYSHDQVPSGPWSLHIVKIERSNPDFEIQTMLGGGTHFGLASITDQARLFPRPFGRPIAAINGDFYENDEPYQGDPKGLQIVHNELVSAPSNWTCFWIDAAGNPQMGKVASMLQATLSPGHSFAIGLNEERTSKTAVLYTHAVGATTHTRVGVELVLEPETAGAELLLQPGHEYKVKVREVRERADSPIQHGTWILSLGPDLLKKNERPQKGSIVQINTATSPDIKDARAAISGGPPLVHEGKVQPNRRSEVRHPRAAIGWNKDYIFLVEVDGRQPKLSIGMTYYEFAAYLQKIGCEEALNLDGGGSATCWFNGQIVNSPSEHQERGIGNAVVLVHKSEK